jgi:hypothetical protein
MPNERGNLAYIRGYNPADHFVEFFPSAFRTEKFYFGASIAGSSCGNRRTMSA